MAQGFAKESFYAVKDVSFELRRGELRTLGRSEKEISKKCLGATKGPDSGRSRHQCLGLIGHNGAGNQAAVQPLGRLPKAARRVRRRGKARINMTLLKMLNGLIKPDAGTITMRGRVGALIALGAGFFYLWRPTLPDLNDDMVLELAIAGSASTIITDNTKDFGAASQFGIEIQTPYAFIQKTTLL